MFKDRDRVEIKLRISVVTVFELYLDFSSGKYRLVLLNFIWESY